MLQRDESIIRAIHDERSAGLYGHGPERRVLADRVEANGPRKAFGHALVRLGMWLSADPTQPAQPHPRVPSSA